MNKERYNQIIGEVYEKYSIIAGVSTQVEALTKEEFINKIKTDSEFSKKWGLKVEVRELSLGERHEIWCKKENIRNNWEQIYSLFGGWKKEMDSVKTTLNNANIPTKSITIEYNNERVEIYEN